MQNAEFVDFTDEDFMLLGESLEALKDKKSESDLAYLLLDSFVKNEASKGMRTFMEAEMEKAKKQQREKKQQAVDRLIELQYKLIQFKKWYKWASVTVAAPNYQNAAPTEQVSDQETKETAEPGPLASEH